MATSAANGQSDANGTPGGLSAAQKLMQIHDEAHKATIEDIPDESDLKHPEAPHSNKALESKDDSDSVPTWTAPLSAKAAGKQKEQAVPEKKQSLDTQSHDLFPELGGAPKTQAAPSVASIWGGKKPSGSSPVSSNGKVNGSTSTNGVSKSSAPTSGTATPIAQALPRGGPNAIAIPGRHSERISLAPTQLIPRTQMKKPIQDVLKDINKRSRAVVTMTTGNAGLLWFNATGPQEACRQALKDIVEQIGAKQSIKVAIPRSTRAHIIGKQGSTIKALQEKTGARIQMPKTDDSSAPVDDDDDEATVDVLIEGNALSAEMARVEVAKIVGERTATVNHKLRGIPAEFYPFIAGLKNERIAEIEEGKNIQIQVPPYHTWTSQPPPQSSVPGQPPNFLPAALDNHITIFGDRLAVQEARAQIERQAEELRRQLILEQIAINKGRHQFIIGDRGIPVQDFFAETGCAIILPGDDEDEIITIVGPADKVQAGLERAMDLASSMHSTNLDISRQHRNAPGGAAAHARNLTRYLQQRKEVERLEKLHKAHIVTPMPSEGSAPWELYSRDGKNAIRAQSEITSIVNGHPPSRIANVNVDPFFHLHLRKDVLPKVQENYGVYMVIPNASEVDAPVLLVFEGPAGAESDYQIPRTQPTPSDVLEFQRNLAEAEKYVLDIISGQEQITSTVIDVPQKYHEKLRKYIKKEQEQRSIDQIPVRVTASGTMVTLRGTSSAVETLASKVNTFIEQEIADDKERGFTLSFDFPQKHANQLIGKGGSNIRELRDRFDVEIQVNDGKVELKGPKAKAEAAKAHITSVGKQWADEATHILKVDPKYHRELIGAQGNQINKLQTRYKVQINFPKTARPVRDDQSVDGNEAAAQKPGRRILAEDEVTVRGPSRGADEARDEILSLLQYLKDNSHAATVSVQQSQLPSLIGQGGKGMDELRQATGAKIDVPGSREAKDASGLVDIQIKGTKAQVALAKKLIEEKKSVFDQTVTKTLDVDKKHHRTLIGAGGSNLRDIVVKAGGSDDRRVLARTVQFPRAEADGNLIKIEGSLEVVDKIIAAMQEIVSQRDSQTTDTLDVPTEKHRNLIGRGGETKKELESKFKVSLDIPRQGNGQTGVKITGLPADVATAKAHIAELTKIEEGEEVQVPRKFHHTISENGMFFRKLKSDHGVTVDHAGQKLPPKPSATANPRANGGALPLITDAQDDDAFSWNVVSLDGSDVDGEIPWILRGPPSNVQKAKAALAAALEQAQKSTSTGYLVLPDPRSYRFVIGQGGSKVNSIRKQTGCKINVPKDQAKDEAIEILGSAEGVEQAKELILEAIREGSNNNNGRS